MSDIGGSGMSDNGPLSNIDLRTRIAAVIASCRIPPDDMTSDEIADAVIAELGLRPEWGALDDTDSGTLADDPDDLKVWSGETLKHRYITAWVEA